jgi:ADP-L-glycero-D-manno-heptose 6-epimerase
MTSSTFVVTGAAGFVGSNLAAELLRRDPRAHVLAVDDFSSGSFANLVEACARRGVGAFRGEVLARSAAQVDWADLARHRAPRAIFHLGAITDTRVTDERRMIEVNLGGFRAHDPGSMLAAAARADIPLVYASSAATYGAPPQAARREAFPESAAGCPSNVYGFSKWLMEQEHAEFVRLHPRARVVGLRYFNVFGPGESRKGAMASMAYQLAQQALAGQRPRLFRDGGQARDQVYVDDVVDGTLAAAGLGPRGAVVEPGVYNLGSGRATTFNELAGAVRAGLGLAAGDREVEFIDMPPAVRAFYQDFTQADMTHASRGLGWRPAHSPPDAIRRYAAHLAGRAG